jgi:hypothetical protein
MSNRSKFMCVGYVQQEQALSADDADDISSYGSEPSSEGRMQSTRLAMAASGSGDMATLFAAIATFARGQAIVTEKLEFLEKAVGTVQFDMTWVRDDMKVVHQVVEKMVDTVYNIHDDAVELDRAREQVSLDASPPLPWRGKEQVADIPKPPSASTSRGDAHYADDNLNICNVGRDVAGNFIEDIHAHMPCTDSHTERNNNTVEGRKELEHARDTLPALCLTPWPEPRVTIEQDLLDEESQQIDFSCQSTQLPTPMTGRHMWSDFAAAVRDWPAPSAVGTGLEEGWVPTKKGRWDTMDYGKDMAGAGIVAEAATGGTLNLNTLPEGRGESARQHGRGPMAAPTSAFAAPSSKGANGTGRGSGRGRGLLDINPRFHNPVSGGFYCSVSSVCSSLATLDMHARKSVSKNVHRN